MNVFSDYARYYDLLYQDKEYDKEVAYINDTVQKLKPGAQTILNIGCGTGRHDVLLNDCGYIIKGIDLSETMIGLANELQKPDQLVFEVADATTYRDGKIYDAVISLFHVVNYQCSNEALLFFFKTAAVHLRSGGVFIFDSWYGPALLSDKPYEKIKEMENDEIKIIRKTIPFIEYNENIAHIHFNVKIESKKTKEISELNERHSMRYLFHPEIQRLATEAGFRILKFTKWMSDEVPSEKSWYVIYGLEKI